MTESELILKLKNGSNKAFEELYAMYAGRLFSFCYKYIKTKQEAEEIVEDVFVKLWIKRETIDEEKSLSGLLFTISRRQLINAYRARVNSNLFADYVEQVYEQHDPVAYEDFVGKLEKAIDNLPSTQSKVVRMSKFECLKNKDIAERLNLSEQTVKNQLSIALSTLKKEIGDVSPMLFLLFLLK